MSNPYQSPTPSPPPQFSSTPPTYRKVAIEPVECLKASKELVGDQYWLFVGIVAVGMLIAGAVPMNILLGPMMCGIYLCYLRRMRGESADFNLLFKGFDYFLESFLATLVFTGISFAVMIPLYCVMCSGMVGAGAAAEGGGEEAMPFIFIGLYAFLILGILLVCILMEVFFMFTFLLIVDHGLKAIPAVTTSYRAAKANFGGLLGLMGLIMLLSMAGSCLCFVGVYLVAPITMGAAAIAYRKVFPEEAGSVPAKPGPV